MTTQEKREPFIFSERTLVNAETGMRLTERHVVRGSPPAGWCQFRGTTTLTSKGRPIASMSYDVEAANVVEAFDRYPALHDHAQQVLMQKLQHPGLLDATGRPLPRNGDA